MSHRGNTNDRRSGNGRDDRRRDDDRRPRERDDSARTRTSGAPQRSVGGDYNRNNNGDARPGHGSFGGGGGGHRGGANSFSGMAFSESELMSDLPKKKFTGRCRLFVGNLPNEVKEAELKEMFTPHGDIAECYLSGKGFAFLRMDTRAHAESAKEAIDGRMIHNRQVRVRFAVHGAALRVKELSSTVSNEMLYHAFSHFGEVERAVHIVDEKGRPTGEGIVEFERKPNCNEATQSIREKVFLLTASPKPLVVEILEPRDEDDGLAERMIPRTSTLAKERELGPRFPAPNSFEYVYGMKWKELYDMERQRRAQLEEELRDSRRRLEADMELAYQDYQAQMLREDLQRRQQELERLEAARRDRMGMRAAVVGGSVGGHNQPPPVGGGPMNGPGQGYPGGFQNSGMGMGNGPMGMGGGNPMGPNTGGMGPFTGGPPPNLFGGGGPNGPPPNHPQNQGQGSQRPPNNMIEGVQRLLQIFKNEPVGNSPRGPPGPGAFVSGPGIYGGGPPGYNDFPPEKKIRR